MAEDQGYFAAEAAHQEELERLREMEALSDQTTTRLLTGLGVGAGWRCLEIGAGGGSVARWLSDHLDSRMWLTMSERLDVYLVSEGLLGQDEVDATRGALKDPSFWLRNGMTVSAWGQRSG